MTSWRWREWALLFLLNYITVTVMLEVLHMDELYTFVIDMLALVVYTIMRQRELDQLDKSDGNG